jgi:hypothetical protein
LAHYNKLVLSGPDYKTGPLKKGKMTKLAQVAIEAAENEAASLPRNAFILF